MKFVKIYKQWDPCFYFAPGSTNYVTGFAHGEFIVFNPSGNFDVIKPRIVLSQLNPWFRLHPHWQF
jgi:hypothetical protein